MITQVAGSSDYFLGGVIAYSKGAKVELLGVKRATLNRCGAASSSMPMEATSQNSIGAPR